MRTKTVQPLTTINEPRSLFVVALSTAAACVVAVIVALLFVSCLYPL